MNLFGTYSSPVNPLPMETFLSLMVQILNFWNILPFLHPKYFCSILGTQGASITLLLWPQQRKGDTDAFGALRQLAAFYYCSDRAHHLLKMEQEKEKWCNEQTTRPADSPLDCGLLDLFGRNWKEIRVFVKQVGVNLETYFCRTAFIF